MASQKTSRWMGLTGAMVGLSGLAINFVDFRANAPHLRLEVESVGLQAAVSWSSFPDSLRRIEDDFGGVTGTRVIALEEFASTVRSTDTSRLRELERRILDQAAYFGASIRRWRPHDIRITKDSVLYPDGTSLDVATPRLVRMLAGPLLDKLRSGEALEAGETAQIQEQADLVHRPPDPADSARRFAIAYDLRRLGGIVADQLDNRATRIVAQLLVENVSRVPTVLRPRGILRFHRDATVLGDIPVEVTDLSVLAGSSIGHLTVQSRLLGSMDSTDRAFILEAFRQDRPFLLFLEEMHQTIWHASGFVSTLPRRSDDARLKERVDRAFLSTVRRSFF